MNNAIRFFVSASLCVSLAVLFSCSHKPDLKAIAKEGQIILKYQDKDVPLKVEVMDVFLVNPGDESRFPETFDLRGADFEVVGSFPINLHVGYEEDFQKIVYHTVFISESADPGGEGERSSKVVLPGVGGIAVTGGTIEVRKVLGNSPDGAGKIISGQIRLDLASGSSAEGSFVFLAKTWG